MTNKEFQPYRIIEIDEFNMIIKKWVDHFIENNLSREEALNSSLILEYKNYDCAFEHYKVRQVISFEKIINIIVSIKIDDKNHDDLNLIINEEILAVFLFEYSFEINQIIEKIKQQNNSIVVINKNIINAIVEYAYASNQLVHGLAKGFIDYPWVNLHQLDLGNKEDVIRINSMLLHEKFMPSVVAIELVQQGLSAFYNYQKKLENSSEIDFLYIYKDCWFQLCKYEHGSTKLENNFDITIMQDMVYLYRSDFYYSDELERSSYEDDQREVRRSNSLSRSIYEWNFSTKKYKLPEDTLKFMRAYNMNYMLFQEFTGFDIQHLLIEEVFDIINKLSFFEEDSKKYKKVEKYFELIINMVNASQQFNYAYKIEPVIWLHDISYLLLEDMRSIVLESCNNPDAFNHMDWTGFKERPVNFPAEVAFGLISSQSISEYNRLYFETATKILYDEVIPFNEMPRGYLMETNDFLDTLSSISINQIDQIVKNDNLSKVSILSTKLIFRLYDQKIINSMRRIVIPSFIDFYKYITINYKNFSYRSLDLYLTKKEYQQLYEKDNNLPNDLRKAYIEENKEKAKEFNERLLIAMVQSQDDDTKTAVDNNDVSNENINNKITNIMKIIIIFLIILIRIMKLG